MTEMRFKWVMEGTAYTPSPGAMRRAEVQTGTMTAEGTGSVVDEIVQRGPWDLYDNEATLVITVSPVADE